MSSRHVITRAALAVAAVVGIGTVALLLAVITVSVIPVLPLWALLFTSVGAVTCIVLLWGLVIVPYLDNRAHSAGESLPAELFLATTINEGVSS